MKLPAARSVTLPLVVGSVLGLLWMAAPARADQDTLNASLRHAARLGLLGDVRKLLAEGAEVDAVASYGETALQYAALYGHTGVVRELLRAGAQVNQADYDDNTPLIVAAQNCNHRTVALLVRAGADVNRENHLGSTALTLAAEQNCGRAVGILLTVPGLRARHRDDWGHSALDYARENALGLEYDPETLIRLRRVAGEPGAQAGRETTTDEGRGLP
jgi:ankyrin repeat protein